MGAHQEHHGIRVAAKDQAQKLRKRGTTLCENSPPALMISMPCERKGQFTVQVGLEFKFPSRIMASKQSMTDRRRAQRAARGEREREICMCPRKAQAIEQLRVDRIGHPEQIVVAALPGLGEKSVVSPGARPVMRLSLVSPSCSLYPCCSLIK